MKILVMIAVSGLLASAGSAQAQVKKSEPRPVPRAKPQQADKQARAQVYTGSFLPRPLKVSGQVTDGPYHLVVIDSEAIRRSGAASVLGVLASRGARR